MKHKNQIPIEDKFWNIIAVEGEDQADILLYGVIGQYDWWNEGTEDDETITDLVVVRKIKELERKGYEKINIRINSPGGSVYHGQAIVTAILNSKSEIHTYVDGLAASMAADIWMAGHVRHMSFNSMLMIHAAMGIERGNAKELRRYADVLDKYTETLIPVIAKAGGMTKDEVRSKYYEDYEDHWLTADDCLAEGFISEIEGYEVEPTVNNPQNMNHKALMNQYKGASMPENTTKKKANTMNILNFISNLFNKEVKTEEEAKAVLNEIAEKQKQHEETEFATVENLASTNEKIANLEEKTKAFDSLQESVNALQAKMDESTKAREEQNKVIEEQKKTIESQNTSIENLTKEIASLKGLPTGKNEEDGVILPTGGEGGEDDATNKFTASGDFIEEALTNQGKQLKIIAGV